MRAIRTANLALDEMERLWVPVRRGSAASGERHYGELTGADKAETARRFGEDQVKIWRRSYDVPPPIESGNPSNPNDDARYSNLPTGWYPARSASPTWWPACCPTGTTRSVPDLQAESVLVVAHGNSLRALVKHLQGISDSEITELNIPTGVPLRYELDDHMAPTSALEVTERYLMDPAEVAARAEAVAKQASGG
ncbi:MAG: 2,3-bisphosphoglycerate-dependent phosphoglycerate mutase [Microthrixaceae bacterium]